MNMNFNAFLNYINHTLPISLLETKKGYKALDVGCGSGTVVELLRNKHLETYGLDMKKYCSDIVLGDASKLSFKRNSFDIITCILVLPALSVEKEKAALNEFNRVLKPNGQLCLVIYNKSFLNFGKLIQNYCTIHNNKDKKYFSYNPTNDFKKVKYYYQRVHAPKSIKMEMNNIGLHTEKIIIANYSPPLINKLPSFFSDVIYKFLYKNEKYFYELPIFKNWGKRIIIIIARKTCNS